MMCTASGFGEARARAVRRELREGHVEGAEALPQRDRELPEPDGGAWRKTGHPEEFWGSGLRLLSSSTKLTHQHPPTLKTMADAFDCWKARAMYS